MVRLFDILFSFIGLIILSPIFLLLTLLIYLDTGSPIFYQHRVGRCMKPFVLYKFRTMNLSTPSVATHLSDISSITRTGGFLRKSKLDELPQLFNVLIGDMSLVGPRPNLINQHELIQIRNEYNVYRVRPGITGLSQVSKIDMANPRLLAKTDARMIDEFNSSLYFKCIFLTFFGKFWRKINK